MSPKKPNPWSDKPIPGDIVVDFHNSKFYVVLRNGDLCVLYFKGRVEKVEATIDPKGRIRYRTI
jgi:hypothetical protein